VLTVKQNGAVEWSVSNMIADHQKIVSTEMKAKVNLSLCLTKHHTMKTYLGVEI
jgi:hypothetical protein